MAERSAIVSYDIETHFSDPAIVIADDSRRSLEYLFVKECMSKIQLVVYH